MQKGKEFVGELIEIAKSFASSSNKTNTVIINRMIVSIGDGSPPSQIENNIAALKRSNEEDED